MVTFRPGTLPKYLTRASLSHSNHSPSTVNELYFLKAMFYKQQEKTFIGFYFVSICFAMTEVSKAVSQTGIP